jgi:hypothetical protein
MKKIRLNVAKLEATEVLSRDQLKSIFGGETNASSNHCSSNTCSYSIECCYPQSNICRNNICVNR